MNQTQATSLINSAIKSAWDRDFLANDRIKSWLVHEVASVPFDPATKTLLEYVKERMAAAESLQAQQKASLQQQSVQLQAPQIALATPQASTSSPATTQSYTVIEDDSPTPYEQHEEEDYQFGLDDFLDTPVIENGMAVERSPSPMPSAALPIQHPPSHPSTSTSAYPFYSAQAQQQQQQPSSHAQPQQSFYSHEPLQHHQSSVLDPSMLSLQQHGGMTSTISPFQLAQLAQQNQYQSNAFISPSQAQIQSPARPTSSAQIIVSQQAKREKSPGASTQQPPKRQRTESVDETVPYVRASQSKTAQTSSPTKSALKPTPDPRPATESEKVWQKIEPELRRNLNLANKAPIGTVMKIFKLLSLYVTEPANATKTGAKEASVGELSVPPIGRNIILNVLKEKTEEAFDQCFVTDPRATVLLAEWAKDLAFLCKGKAVAEADEEGLKSTSRPLMEVFRKLPISLPVLQSLKGVGKYVQIISKTNTFDEVTKDVATQLVKKWQRMAGAKDGTASSALRAVTGASVSSVKKRAETPSDTEDVRKKRKVSPTGPPLPVKNKVKAEPADVKPLVKAPIKPTASATTSNMSTKPLGAPTTKALPMFAKRKPNPAARPPAATKPAVSAPTPAPAPAADFNPFSMALEDMKKQMENASGMSLGDTLSMLHSAVDTAGGNKVPRASSGKKPKKSVRWKEEDSLEQIKLVPILVYGDEFGNEITAGTDDYFNTVGETIGEGEGEAMKQLVEEIEWDAPPIVEINLPPESMPAVYPLAELMGDQKPEAEVQKEREQSVLATNYFEDSDIPFTPHEPASVLAENPLPDEHESIKKMKLGYALSQDESVKMAIAQAMGVPYAPPAFPQPAVAAPMQGVEYQQPGQTSSTSNGFIAPPPAAGAPQDLNALLAKLSDPAAVPQTANTPPLAQQEPYGYDIAPQQPMPGPVNPYQAGSYQMQNSQPPMPYSNPGNGSRWGRSAPAPPPPPRSIDWTNVGILPPDAYKRKKGGRRM